MHIIYSLFLFISASVLVYCIFFVCIFSFDATILVNKDVYIHNRCSKCPPFAATQAPGASLQGEDPDCGGVAAAHYGGVGNV